MAKVPRACAAVLARTPDNSEKRWQRTHRCVTRIGRFPALGLFRISLVLNGFESLKSRQIRKRRPFLGGGELWPLHLDLGAGWLPVGITLIDAIPWYWQQLLLMLYKRTVPNTRAGVCQDHEYLSTYAVT